jgi:hypothetical protein
MLLKDEVKEEIQPTTNLPSGIIRRVFWQKLTDISKVSTSFSLSKSTPNKQPSNQEALYAACFFILFHFLFDPEDRVFTSL